MFDLKIFDLKTSLIFLCTVAVILGVFAYFAVFGNSGTYAVNSFPSSTGAIATSTTLTLPSSTASSSFGFDIGNVIGGATSSASGTAANGGPYGTVFSQPALTWPESGAHISINAVSLEGGAMTFTLTVTNGGQLACIPLNLRLVADEAGDLNPPSPAAFSFPDSGNCNAAPNQTYTNQTADFTVDPTALPLLFTTGGASNIFFEIATTTNDGLSVDFPGTSG
jgi:hypothetical protein